MGLRLRDLERLSVGTVMDILTEAGNDHETYAQIAGQEDFDAF